MRINFLVALVAAMGHMGHCLALYPPSNTLHILCLRKMDSRSKFITSTVPDVWKVRSSDRVQVYINTKQHFSLLNIV